MLRYLFSFPLLVGIIGMCCAAYFAYRLAQLEDSPAKKRLGVLGSLASLLLIISSVWSGFEQEKQGQSLATATAQNTQLSARIVDLTEKNAALITGGEHFCYFDPVETSDTSTNEFTWYLVRMGRGTPGPIYDISCSIIDINALRAQPQPGTPSAPNSQALAAATESIHLGTLNPGEHRIFRKVSLADVDSQAYIVRFSARNGSWSQTICFERVNGKWTRAIRFKPDHETAGFIPSEPWITGEFPTNAIP